MVARDGEGYVALASFCPSVPSAAPKTVAVKLLVDCSGSMAGDSIASAKQALHKVLEQLDPGDRFTLSRFGSQVAHSRPRLVNVDENTIRSAADAISRLDADMGGTEMEKALLSTFALGTGDEPADVLLITDGEIWKTETVVDLARRSSHRIFAVGVGSSPADSLLRRLAMETGGACELVSPNEDIAGAIVRMFERLRQSRVGQLEVAWPGQPKWVTPLPSAMFDGDTLHAFAGFSDPPVGIAELAYVADDAQHRQGITVDLPSATESADTLSRVAAFERMKSLPRGKEKLDLALQYQLVTEDTNLIVVHARAKTIAPRISHACRKLRTWPRPDGAAQEVLLAASALRWRGTPLVSSITT